VPVPACVLKVAETRDRAIDGLIARLIGVTTAFSGRISRRTFRASGPPRPVPVKKGLKRLGIHASYASILGRLIASPWTLSDDFSQSIPAFAIGVTVQDALGLSVVEARKVRSVVTQQFGGDRRVRLAKKRTRE